MKSTDIGLVCDTNPMLKEELVLPSQYFETRTARPPEVNLVSRIITDVIANLTGQAVVKQSDWDDDHTWAFDDSPRPWGFLWCCKLLELNHYAVRGTLVKHAGRKESHLALINSVCKAPDTTPTNAYRKYKCRCARCGEAKRMENQQRNQACLTSQKLIAIA